MVEAAQTSKAPIQVNSLTQEISLFFTSLITQFKTFHFINRIWLLEIDKLQKSFRLIDFDIDDLFVNFSLGL
jgi:hypothetical protein